MMGYDYPITPGTIIGVNFGNEEIPRRCMVVRKNAKSLYCNAMEVRVSRVRDRREFTALLVNNQWVARDAH